MKYRNISACILIVGSSLCYSSGVRLRKGARWVLIKKHQENDKTGMSNDELE